MTDGKVQLILGGSIPGQDVLGSITKQAEQAMRSKPVSSTRPWPLYWFLPPDSYTVLVPVLTSFDNEQGHESLSLIYLPFLPQLAFGHSGSQQH